MFVGFVQIFLDPLLSKFISLWLNMEIKLFSYDLSSCTCLAVELQL